MIIKDEQKNTKAKQIVYANPFVTFLIQTLYS